MRVPHHSTVVAYLALFVALGGTAMAVTRSSQSPTITACYAKRTGALRVLLRGHCGRGQRSISWNKTGVAGPAGPTGTVDTSGFYTKAQSDARYLPVAGVAADASNLGGQPASSYVTTTGTATNASELGGQPPSAYAASRLLGSPALPANPSGGADSSCFVSEIRLMAGAVEPSNWTLANGQVLSISSNTALFSLIGTTYGGNGTSNFALPNLSGAQPKGAGPAGVNYYICTGGIFP